MGEYTVIGNLTNDPELRYTPSGAAVVKFRVAENSRKYNKQTQEWEDAGTSFYTVTAWRNLAENAAESLGRGDKVIVKGNLKVRDFQRDDGSKGISVEIEAVDIGPALSVATAQVSKARRAGGGNGNAPAAGGQPAADAAARHDDPWGAPPGPGSEPPF